jgi:hypothetical protein
LNVDVAGALSALAAHRPVFHSERDLQHALAWQSQAYSSRAAPSWCSSTGTRSSSPTPSANDISRHDVIKDITRVEAMVADEFADRGCVLVLTNDRSYWQPSTRADAIDAEFRLHEGRILQGTASWAARAGAGTAARPGKHDT